MKMRRRSRTRGSLLLWGVAAVATRAHWYDPPRIHADRMAVEVTRGISSRPEGADRLLIVERLVERLRASARTRADGNGPERQVPRQASDPLRGEHPVVES